MENDNNITDNKVVQDHLGDKAEKTTAAAEQLAAEQLAAEKKIRDAVKNAKQKLNTFQETETNTTFYKGLDTLLEAVNLIQEWGDKSMKDSVAEQVSAYFNTADLIVNAAVNNKFTEDDSSAFCETLLGYESKMEAEECHSLILLISKIKKAKKAIKANSDQEKIAFDKMLAVARADFEKLKNECNLSKMTSFLAALENVKANALSEKTFTAAYEVLEKDFVKWASDAAKSIIDKVAVSDRQSLDALLSLEKSDLGKGINFAELKKKNVISRQESEGYGFLTDADYETVINVLKNKKGEDVLADIMLMIKKDNAKPHALYIIENWTPVAPVRKALRGLGGNAPSSSEAAADKNKKTDTELNEKTISTFDDIYKHYYTCDYKVQAWKDLLPGLSDIKFNNDTILDNLLRYGLTYFNYQTKFLEYLFFFSGEPKYKLLYHAFNGFYKERIIVEVLDFLKTGTVKDFLKTVRELHTSLVKLNPELAVLFEAFASNINYLESTRNGYILKVGNHYCTDNPSAMIRFSHIALEELSTINYEKIIRAFPMMLMGEDKCKFQLVMFYGNRMASSIDCALRKKDYEFEMIRFKMPQIEGRYQQQKNPAFKMSAFHGMKTSMYRTRLLFEGTRQIDIEYEKVPAADFDEGSMVRGTCLFKRRE